MADEEQKANAAEAGAHGTENFSKGYQILKELNGEGKIDQGS
jgi:hypothetical protein